MSAIDPERLSRPLLTGVHATDPNAPKRSLSAYMFFANDQRESVRSENAGVSFGTGSWKNPRTEQLH